MTDAGYDLAGAAYDRPLADGRVRRSYVLATAPRSGSSLLAEALHGLGGLGTPIEYFDRTATHAWLAARWGATTAAEYVGQLHRRRATDDGLLGAKVHWFQLVELAARLDPPPLPGPRGRERAAVARAFPACRFVTVRRADRDAQAVSWALAQQTGHWGRGPGQPAVAHEPVPRYDRAAIDDCRRRIVDSERGWADLLVAARARPLAVTYEQLSTDYAGTVARVAHWLGRPTTPREVPAPRLHRQADERSAAMLARNHTRGVSSQAADSGGG